MTRFTKEMRDSILHQLLKRAFLDRLKKQLSDEAAFAEELYQDIYGKELPLIEKVPSHWFDTSASIRVSIAGQQVQLSYSNGNTGQSDFSEIISSANQKSAHKPVPHQAGWWTVAEYSANSKQDKKWTALSDARGTLQAEYNQARNQAKAILGSTSSIKKLIEIWPEVEESTKPYLTKQGTVTTLPVVQLEALNKILDLPPETKAA